MGTAGLAPNTAIGGSSSTVTVWVVLILAPAASVTVNLTLYEPGAG